ncbi:MAG: DUF305 domain-containing protein [Porticoccaceae bacterium]
MSLQSRLTPSNRSTLTARAAVIAAAIVTTTPMSANANEPAKNESMSAEQTDHSKMDDMKDMEGMSMTGVVVYDFATNRRMHHMKALEMAEAEIKNGKNSEMQKLATDIIVLSKKEITEFDRWPAAHKKS